jgi:uncharacterized protein (TIGR02996 family)
VTNVEKVFLRALQDDPHDETAWLALADWLEEQADVRGELVRLLHLLRQSTAHPERPRQEERLRELLAAGVCPCVPLLTNSIGMRLALIPPGVFLMGSPEDEKARRANEGPRQEVTISRPFYLGFYPVTQKEYQRITGSNPSHFSATGQGRNAVQNVDTKRCPVENVSWNDAKGFCDRLSELPQEKRAGRVYRLPTEAEWEYACRAGTSTVYAFGDRLTLEQANFGSYPGRGTSRKKYVGRPSPVGSYPGNGFGLFDMHGNVYEWCADLYSKTYSRRRPRRDPTGPKRGTQRVLRGGCWFDNNSNSRSAARHHLTPIVHASGLGMRVALTAAPR